MCKCKFRHNFQDSLDSFCKCSRHIETTIHFFIHCSNYSNQRKILFDKINNIKRSLLNQNDVAIVETFLFGSKGVIDIENALTIESTIEYSKVHSSIVMSPFKQISTFLEIFNWFWITLFHIFQLFVVNFFWNIDIFNVLYICLVERLSSKLRCM